MYSIRDIRLSLGLNQKQVSTALNIQQNTFSQYETGKRQPSIHILPKLAKVLKCSIEDIVYCFCEKE